MKRSQNVVCSRMRKANWRYVSFGTVAVASTALVGCGEEVTPSTMYASVNDCISDNSEYASECSAAYEDAVREAERTAPKYSSAQDCASEFGYENCAQSRQGSWFMPMMAGYMFSNIIHGNRNYYSQPLFTSSNRRSPYYNSWVASDGKNYGRSYSKSKTFMSKSDMQPKPTVSRTMSRGGFGSKAAAKSSWGSSSTKSWGG
ncbi:DUF1190 domain-containing protein [Aliivibrio kagoshimensis]|uniref:DUF1190 domain-containing protein n=1 Tax=Aliivibrio kagoshimensis TaxID=2910230 RepID=UPI003D0E44C9